MGCPGVKDVLRWGLLGYRLRGGSNGPLLLEHSFDFLYPLLYALVDLSLDGPLGPLSSCEPGRPRGFGARRLEGTWSLLMLPLHLLRRGLELLSLLGRGLLLGLVLCLLGVAARAGPRCQAK